MNSQFKTIENFPNYKINEEGCVKNKTTGNELKHGYTGKDRSYHAVVLHNSEHPRGQTNKIHRLVYYHFSNFIDEFSEKQVDHIDRNPDNNHINNLKLVTNSENKRNQTKYKTHKKKKCSSDFRGVNLFKNKWCARLNYDKNRRFFLGYFKNQVNAGYVWYHVMKHFREIKGDNKAFLDAELPEEDEGRDEKIKGKIREIESKINN